MCKRVLAVAVAGGVVVFLSACAGGSERLLPPSQGGADNGPNPAPSGSEAASPSRGGADNGPNPAPSTEVTTNTAPPGSVEDYWTDERMRNAQPQPMPSE